MKSLFIKAFVGVLIFTCFACGTTTKPYYETAIGKKKQDHYNRAQYGMLNKTGYYKRK